MGQPFNWNKGGKLLILKAGAALAIAGLGADGVTTIFGYDHIARGYEDLAGMLFMLGAQAALRE